MKILVHLVWLLALQTPLFGQVKIHLPDNGANEIYLARYSPLRVEWVESDFNLSGNIMQVNVLDTAFFCLMRKDKPAVRLYFWTGLDKDLVLVLDSGGDVVVEQGSFHRQWYANEKRVEIWVQFLERFFSDSIGNACGKELLMRHHYLELQSKFGAISEELGKTTLGNWRKSLIPPFSDSLLCNDTKIEYLIRNFLRNVNFANPVLQKTHYLGDKVEQYLMLMDEKEGSVNNWEALDATIKAILEHCRNFPYNNIDDPTSAVLFVTNHMRMFFLKSGNEIGLERLAHNLLPDLLEEATISRYPYYRNAIEHLTTYLKWKNGMPVKEISFVGDRGVLKDLSDIQATFTILFFWDSRCGNCDNVLPVFEDWYRSQDSSTVKVLMISLDQDSTAWAEAVRKITVPVYHYCDFKGRQGEVVRDYGIISTPTFWVLDERKRLIGRAGSLSSLLDTFLNPGSYN